MNYLIVSILAIALSTMFPPFGYVCIAYLCVCATAYYVRRAKRMAHSTSLTITKD